MRPEPTLVQFNLNNDNEEILQFTFAAEKEKWWKNFGK
ncbi:hypothetical protein Goshw_011206 [Gossypium schwendimanii]|uniref:Uncharacterized protein n=1 Tax=Gossypium schwendimanii TaxID=34291 RepID=A0A7J9MSW0_GOSSC|nr:hypothetical protein [Gossypium schwendimanii]